MMLTHVFKINNNYDELSGGWMAGWQTASFLLKKVAAQKYIEDVHALEPYLNSELHYQNVIM